MPILKDNRIEKKINLLSDSEAEIIIKDGLLAGEIERIESENNKRAQSFAMLECLIKSWNFTDEKGNPLPVNIENIKKMDIKDIEHVLCQVTFISEYIKKNTMTT